MSRAEYEVAGGVPRDRFTPHGYLDNPFHTRNLNPSGVIRSVDGIGFGWHVPALGRGYGYREIYRASLQVGLVLGGRVLWRSEHLRGLYADVHTMNRFRFVWRDEHEEVTVTWHRVGEHALACRIRIDRAGGAEGPASRTSGITGVVAVVRYELHLGAAGVWGHSGLVAQAQNDTLVVQAFEDGTALALTASAPWTAVGAAPDIDTPFLLAPAFEDRGGTGGHEHTVTTGGRGESVVLHGVAHHDLRAAERLDLVLGRGPRRDLAIEMSKKAMDRRDASLSELADADRRFWSRAPRLSGDWPAHWRRGLVYDLETLRMMVREPIGIYRHVWDAMQIQAPRTVLAEASIDALLLSYVDPSAAKALFLGTFLDAVAPNVPCSREDGTFNMVSANGSECGTAPEWGYPFLVAKHIFSLTGDRAWLAAIYDPLASFLDWWMEHRSDDEGYLVYDNSWESGQDMSARFGPQREGGGSTIRMVRPVDLQAAACHACAVLADFAGELVRPDARRRWSDRRDAFQERVHELWHDGAYRDYDRRVGWSDVWDVMQLAPVALGVAPKERIDALLPTVRTLHEEPYLWPMFVWTATESAMAAGEVSVAGHVAYDTVDRAYGYWDAPRPGPDDRLPGITCEYWGTDGRCGAEGYGWGAFGVHLLVRVLAGFRPSDEGIVLEPALPPELCEPGTSYRIHNLTYRQSLFDLELTPEDGGIRARIDFLPDPERRNPERLEAFIPHGHATTFAI